MYLLIYLFYRRKFEYLTSDYTRAAGGCVYRRKYEKQKRCHSTVVVHGAALAGRSSAKRSFSIVSRARKLDERRLWRISCPRCRKKCAPRCSETAVRKPKSLNIDIFGTFFEVEIRKTCTTL